MNKEVKLKKPSKKVIEKLRIFSELSYDNIVRISDTGNYFVRFRGPSKVDFEQEMRPENVTKGTIGKLHKKTKIKYEICQHVLMLTRTGKLLLGEPRPTHNSYLRGIKWTSLSVSNFRKYGSHFRVEGKPDIEARTYITQLVFANSKCKWLLNYPFFTYRNSLHHKIILNYSSLSELKNGLGYNFLSPKTFTNLLTHWYLDEDDKEPSNYEYINELFTILLYGKLFSEKSRRNLIIVLLRMFNSADNPKDLHSPINTLYHDIHNYVRRAQQNNKIFVELPDTLAGITMILTTDNNDDDENLPF